MELSATSPGAFAVSLGAEGGRTLSQAEGKNDCQDIQTSEHLAAWMTRRLGPAECKPSAGLAG